MEMNKNIEKWYELHTDEVNALSDDIWAHPEVGMQEHYAAKATAAFMRKYGFEVQELDAAMKGDEPNCVIAKWGSGKPVIGIIGELDALPGLGQEAVPYPDGCRLRSRRLRSEGNYGGRGPQRHHCLPGLPC